MRSIGIAISREELSAVVWEKNLFAARLVCACTVPCREPFGGDEDVAALAARTRGEAGSLDAPATLSLPAAWTFIREVELPVQDLSRAKALHLAEIEGTFPFDDEEIVSDILPAPSARPGRFLAVASRRPIVEKAASLFAGAGFRVARIVPEVVALFSAARGYDGATEGLVLSMASDVVAIRLEGGAVAAARQFPEAVLRDAAPSPAEWDGLLDGTEEVKPPVRVIGARPLPAALAERLGPAVSLAMPSGIAPEAAAALGAALLPWEERVTGGFSLAVRAVAESISAMRRTRVLVASAFGAAALVAAVSALLLSAWAEGKKVEKIATQLRKELVEIFPGTPAGPQPIVQFRERIRSLKLQQKETNAGAATFVERLRKVAQALPAKEKIAVAEILYDGGKLRIAGEADSAPLVERFRSGLAAAFGPEAAVVLESSTGRAGRGGVGYTIIVETKETPDAS